MYDKDGSGCIDKTELKEIVEVIISHVFTYCQHGQMDLNINWGYNTSVVYQIKERKKDKNHNWVCSGCMCTEIRVTWPVS